MKIVNSIGPRRLPCRTTDATGAHCEAAPSTTTRWTRPLRYFLKQFKNRPETPYALSLARRMLWSTESKAFAKSK